MCVFLYELSLHSSTNLMGLANLGTVMGPNLLRPPDHKVSSFVQDSPMISECIQMLIKNHDQIKKSEHSLKSQPRPAPLRAEKEEEEPISPRQSEAGLTPAEIKATRYFILVSCILVYVSNHFSRPKRFAVKKDKDSRFDV